MKLYFFSKAILITASVVLISVLFLLTPSNVSACLCDFLTPRQALERADAAFVGKVTNIQEIEKEEIYFGSLEEVQLKLYKVLKGDLGESVIMNVNPSESHCGYEFENNKTYVVFANEYDNELKTSYCDGTFELSIADVLDTLWISTIFAVFGFNNFSPTIFLALVLLIITSLFYIVFKKRKLIKKKFLGNNKS